MSHRRGTGPDAGDERLGREPDERLAAFVDDAMGARERERFVAELRVNPQLQRDLDEYERTVDAVRRALCAETAPTDVADRVMRALAQEATGAARRAADGGLRTHRGFQWTVRIAAAAALFLLAIWIHALAGPSPPKTDAVADALDGAPPPTFEPTDLLGTSRQPAGKGEGHGDRRAEVTTTTAVAAGADPGAAAGEQHDATGEAPGSQPGPTGDAEVDKRSADGLAHAKAGPPAPAGQPGAPEAAGEATVAQIRGVVEKKVPAEEPMRMRLAQPRLQVVPDVSKKGEDRNAEPEVTERLGPGEAQRAVEPPKPAAPPTGSDDFFLGAARRDQKAEPDPVKSEAPADVLPTPVLMVTRFVDPPAEAGRAAGGGGAPAGPKATGPASAGPAGPASPGPTARGRPAAGATAGPGAPAAGRAGSEPSGARGAAEAPADEAARTRRMSARELTFEAFVANQIADLPARKSRTSTRAEDPPELRELRLAEFAALRVLELGAVESPDTVAAEAKEPTSPSAAGSGSVRSWVVEGPPAELKRLMQRLGELARQRGYGLAAGELRLPPATNERRREDQDPGDARHQPAQGGAGGEADAAVGPTRIVLQFRTARRP